MIEDEMVGWHHQLDGHEFEQALGVGDGQTGKPGVLQSMGFSRQEYWSALPFPPPRDLPNPEPTSHLLLFVVQLLSHVRLLANHGL